MSVIRLTTAHAGLINHTRPQPSLRIFKTGMLQTARKANRSGPKIIHNDDVDHLAPSVQDQTIGMILFIMKVRRVI